MSEVNIPGEATASVEVIRPDLAKLAREANVWVKTLGEAASAFAQESEREDIETTLRALHVLQAAADKTNENLSVL